MFLDQKHLFLWSKKSLTAGETRPCPLMATVMNYFHFFWEPFPIQTLLQMLMWWSEVEVEVEVKVEVEVEVEVDCNGGGRGNLS